MELRPGQPGALVDSPDGVVLSGAPPGGTVTIDASLDFCGLQWTCSGEYVADGDGTVDTSRSASSGGSYRGVDPYGLFWSSEVADSYDWDVLHPMRVALRAACDEQTVATSYARPILADRVAEQVVAEPGVVGRLFLPASDQAARGVVIVGGSDGGPGGPISGALLAGHGVPVLSAAYWGHPGTPDALRDIDELALLAASLTPDHVGPVASLVGSGVPWGAWGPGTDVLETGWRFRGEPVPQMVEDEDDPDACIDDEGMVATAEIPIERAAGPVLLLSGEDDAMWPSARLSRIAEERARRRGAGDRVTHVAYPDAGHWCTLPPGFPVGSAVVHPVDGTYTPIGGSRAGNQAARPDAWRRVLAHVGATG